MQAQTEPRTFELDGAALRRIRELEASGRPGFVKKLLDMFLTESAEHLLDLETARTEQRYDDMKFIAHKLKGHSATVGANAFADIAQRLELACQDTDEGLAQKLAVEMRDRFCDVKAALVAEFGGN